MGVVVEKASFNNATASYRRWAAGAAAVADGTSTTCCVCREDLSCALLFDCAANRIELRR